jgi:hypothetical protein
VTNRQKNQEYCSPRPCCVFFTNKRTDVETF